MKKRLKQIAYFAAFTAPMGAQFMAVPVGGMQFSLFRIAICILALGMILQHKGEIVLSRWGNRYSVGFMFFWFFYATISVLWSRDLSTFVRMLFFLFVGTMSIVVCENVFKTHEDYYTAAKWLELGILLQAVIGWYEIFTRDYRFFTMTGANYQHYVLGTQRLPIAMLGNPNDFATLMLLGTALALFAFRSESGKAVKIFHLIAMVNFVILLFVTGSRACILGLLLVGMFIILTLKHRIAAILLCILIVLYEAPNLIDALRNVLQFDFQGTGSDGVRLGLIKSGFVLLGRTFGLGVGTGQIGYWMGLGTGYYTGNITNMHNWWMEILTSFGVIVFIGYIIFYCKLFLDNYRVMKHSRDEHKRSFSLMICAAMVGYVIASVSSSSNMTNEWLWFFWAMCIGYQGIMWDKSSYTRE